LLLKPRAGIRLADRIRHTAWTRIDSDNGDLSLFNAAGTDSAVLDVAGWFQ
jgi:hypothetical protein